MICPKCNQSLDDSCLFCPHCGAALDDAGALAVPEGGAQESLNPFAVGAQTTARSTYGYADDPAPDIPGFGGAIKVCFRKYFQFRGRASRSEYWFWVLFGVLTFWCPIVLGGFLALINVDAGATCLLVPMILAFVYASPGICVGVRRLHDIGRSGWFVLLKIVPYCMMIIYAMSALFLESVYRESIERTIEVSPWISWCAPSITGLYLVGKFVLAILACLPGQKGDNKYGKEPVKHVQ